MVSNVTARDHQKTQDGKFKGLLGILKENIISPYNVGAKLHAKKYSARITRG